MANVKIGFPIEGINKNWPNSTQPKSTSPDLMNVRPRDVSEQRTRGGQRPGLDKWGEGTLVGGAEQPVVAICTVNSVEN